MLLISNESEDDYTVITMVINSYREIRDIKWMKTLNYREINFDPKKLNGWLKNNLQITEQNIQRKTT